MRAPPLPPRSAQAGEATDAPSDPEGEAARRPAAAGPVDGVDLSIELAELISGCCKPFADAVGEVQDVHACFLLKDPEVRPLRIMQGKRIAADRVSPAGARANRWQVLKVVREIPTYAVFEELVRSLATVAPQSMPLSRRICFFLNIYNVLWYVGREQTAATGRATGRTILRSFRVAPP